VDPADKAEAHYAAEAARGNWGAAKADAIAAATAFAAENPDVNPRWVATNVSTQYAPLSALAEAHLGDFGGARRTIDSTPGDCYDCVRTRGEIDQLEGKAGAAAFWYARAIVQAPSLPFATADWGAMLLRRGEYDGAIAKFVQAHAKGPHFADPLEMWGEALIKKDRSDLALAKFAEANQYAPRWGRLHLKWGEALIYVGRPGDAARQFTMAAGLDLTAAERSELARTGAVHG